MKRLIGLISVAALSFVGSGALAQEAEEDFAYSTPSAQAPANSGMMQGVWRSYSSGRSSTQSNLPGVAHPSNPTGYNTGLPPAQPTGSQTPNGLPKCYNGNIVGDGLPKTVLGNITRGLANPDAVVGNEGGNGPPPRNDFDKLGTSRNLKGTTHHFDPSLPSSWDEPQ